MIQAAIEKYKKVQDLNWNETENNPEKELKLKAFHETKKWKYFGNGVSANRTEYIVTNDLTQSSLLWCRVWISNSMVFRWYQSRN